MNTKHKLSNNYHILNKSSQSNNTTNLDNNLDKTYLPHYTQIKSFILDLINKNYSDIDILIKVGETFDKSLAQPVLIDLKRKGIL
jgi:hypothetical protein